VLALGLAAFLAAVPLPAAATPPDAVARVVTDPGALPARPDIVVLVLDDLAETGPRVFERLPTIRRLFLASGVRFSEYVGNDPLCCPGRATLLTGQRSRDHGVVENDARLFDPRVSLATELQGVGYRTMLAGKYFNDEDRLADKTPPGWERVYIGGGYFASTWWDQGLPVLNGSSPWDYTVDVLRRRSTEWLATIPPSDPVFLWLAPYAVHAGRYEDGSVSGEQPVPAPRHRGDRRCAGVGSWFTPAHLEPVRADKPAYLRAHRAPAAFRWGWPMTRVCEALLSTDQLLAAVERTLVAQGRANVVYIVVADNGMGWGQHGWVRKRVPYAAQMPLLVHWRSGLGPVPRTVTSTVTSTDVAPTICAIAGCTLGPFPNGRPVSGRSLVPLLTGTVTSLGRSAIPIEHLGGDPGPRGMPAWQGLRTTDESPLGRWSYVRYATGEVELYDLERDPWQLDNRAGDAAVAPVERDLRLIWGGFHGVRVPVLAGV
jgi:arylsulfatase A-like enzyme